MACDGDGREAVHELRSVSVLSFFDQELRPVFCLDICDDNSGDCLQPVFQNTFLRASAIKDKIFPSLQGAIDCKHDARVFVQWARTSPTLEVDSSQSMRYEDVVWSKATLLGRWRIISGTQCPEVARDTKLVPEKDGSELALQEAEKRLPRDVVHQGHRQIGKSDREAPPSQERMAVNAEHVVGDRSDRKLHLNVGSTSAPSEVKTADSSEDWLDNFEWEDTGLGPRDTWDTQLQTMCRLLLSDPLPAAIYWGPQKLLLYNKPYRWILGRKHPNAMGKAFEGAWAEVSKGFSPIFAQVAKENLAVTSDDAEFLIDRNGFFEQTYFSWSMIPLYGDQGQIVGFYNPVRETTVQKTLYRRMSLLLEISQQLSTIRVIDEFWPRITAALDAGTDDVPFIFLYAAQDHGNEQSTLLTDHDDAKLWKLKGSLGYFTDMELLPQMIGYDSADKDMETFVSHVRYAKEPVLLSTTNGSFPARFLTTINCRGFGESCTQAMFCPLRPSMADVSAAAFVVIGVNPHRPYDEDFKVFIELLTRSMSSSMASVMLFNETVKRSKERAESLSKQLANQVKITEESEFRFQRMADHAPVAMFKYDPTGKLEYGNDDYFYLTQVPRGNQEPFQYRAAVQEVDQHILDDQWTDLTEKLIPVNSEIRLNKRWTSPDGTECPTWVVAAAYPEVDLNGKLMGILGCLTDVSRQKWAEEIQAHKTEQAIELKRQQEMFIDMTSHELRNPLSAIIQSADGIVAGLDRTDLNADGQVCFDASEVASAIDAAQTIIFCAQHQKRISDDVLILSKLNSDLVVITPVDVRPAEVILNGLRVFDCELKKSGIQLRMSVEPSYRELSVDTVRLDPSRMLQVLINLVSNAIKFTTPRKHRQIDVRFGASTSTVFKELDHIRFWHKENVSSGSPTFPSEQWGDGDDIYLYMSVQDTGRGLRDDEMDILFQRFSQASPRTHIQYGGSGLGLFISKRLSEAQGGAIGVSSVPGQGSTFAFYIRTRRSPPNAVSETIGNPVSNTIIIGEKRQIRADVPGLRKDSLYARTNTGSSPCDGRSRKHLPLSINPGQSRSKIAAQERSAIPSQPHLDNKRPLHVLVVEDNLVNQRVLAKQLEKVGYNVVIANHGLEALEHIQRTCFWIAPAGTSKPVETNETLGPPRRMSPILSAESDHLGLSGKGRSFRTGSGSGVSVPSPTTANAATTTEQFPAVRCQKEAPLQLDVVLMDLEMPVMDGITCVKRIRELQGEGKLSRVPVIAVTANARQEQIAAARDNGMDSVVCKPFRIPELVKEISNTLQKMKPAQNT